MWQFFWALAVNLGSGKILSSYWKVRASPAKLGCSCFFGFWLVNLGCSFFFGFLSVNFGFACRRKKNCPLCRRFPISTRSQKSQTKIFRSRSAKVVQKFLGAVQFSKFISQNLRQLNTAFFELIYITLEPSPPSSFNLCCYLKQSVEVQPAV